MARNGGRGPELKRIHLLMTLPGADINAYDYEIHGKPLLVATRRLAIGTVRKLLKHKADPNVSYATGDATALSIALYSDVAQSVDVVRVLLQHNANPNTPSCPETPLRSVCHHHRYSYEKAELLLDYKADPNSGYGSPSHTLEMASRMSAGSFSPPTQILRLVIERKADVNLRLEGKSLLYWACKEGNSETMRALLKACARYDDIVPSWDVTDYMRNEFVWLTEGWRPQRHGQAPTSVKRVVYTVMVLNTIPGTVVYMLPRELLYIIFALLSW